MNKRYYVTKRVTLDLEEVTSIVSNGWVWIPDDGVSGHDYIVTLKNGSTARFIGDGLNAQYREYKGIK